MNPKTKGIFEAAFAKWGFDSQVLVLAEEASELSASCVRFINHKTGSDKVAEEAADVEIMIEQLRHNGMGPMIDHEKNRKMTRLAQIVGVDVGHGQLHASLTNEVRLTVFENTNARYLDSDVLDDAWSDYNTDHETEHEAVSHSFDLAVADLSFISLTKVLPIFESGASSQDLLNNGAHVLALVKPQFELTADDLSKAGIVKDPAKYTEVQANILAACAAHDLTVLDYFASPITGTDGNHEFFVFAQYQTQQLIDSE